MTGFREFQRQSLQQLCPYMFDQDDYNNFDVAVKIFESMELPSDTNFYWVCIQALRDDKFWRKYFIDRAENSFEEKIQFLQALTGFTKDDGRVGKCLSSGKTFGSPSSGGFHSSNPSYGGNNSWGQTSGGQWGQTFANQWGHDQQWGSSPNPQQWNTSPNAQQWGSSPNAPQWRTPPSGQQWSSPPIAPQWDSSLSGQQWGSSPNVSQWIPPTKVQRGFSLGTQDETTTNSQGVFEPRRRRAGGLFNIWGSQQGLNLNEPHQNDSNEDD